VSHCRRAGGHAGRGVDVATIASMARWNRHQLRPVAATGAKPLIEWPT
jgi:crotonobetainyl-CoA:carnitine CoA-transferase CaiB-like acyl-CoA transferase